MQQTSSTWKQWTCDEITPNLCNLSLETGYVKIKSIPVHYWRYKRKDIQHNEIKSLILLHGGPSWPHQYLLPLRQIACQTDYEVIFYDQAGCGASIPSTDEVNITKHSHLLDPKYYSEVELPLLIDHWKLKEYSILGHSWGTILAQLFTLNAKDISGLQSLILSGPLSDAQAYIAAQWNESEGNLGSLPPFVQERIQALEQEKLYDSREYQAIDDVLTTFFTLRTAPAPDCFTTSAKGLNKDIYVGMQGASEFTIGGVLGSFNVTGRLHEIKVPVLLTSGKFDTMRPSIVETMHKHLQKSEWIMFPHSGHVSMIDDAELMNDKVSMFLQRIDEGFTNQVPSERKVDHGNDMMIASGMSTSSSSTWLPAPYLFSICIAFTLGLLIGRLNLSSKRNQYEVIV
ncbi:hypothetical protein CTEN210_00809 [Chaetoceros tenuissimus]|uniref:AB hydrolase-1 domain-containing protein n=1 Tax=Chaetoceros tenuissimus TaxID=426638 RepID=A0AAD3CFV0_9STRA|nr:hypothetical protein CTEN210_00809 [Chaetoceros tenuissimus]